MRRSGWVFALNGRERARYQGNCGTFALPRYFRSAHAWSHRSTIATQGAHATMVISLAPETDWVEWTTELAHSREIPMLNLTEADNLIRLPITEVSRPMARSDALWEIYPLFFGQNLFYKSKSIRIIWNPCIHNWPQQRNQLLHVQYMVLRNDKFFPSSKYFNIFWTNAIFFFLFLRIQTNFSRRAVAELLH